LQSETWNKRCEGRREKRGKSNLSSHVASANLLAIDNQGNLWAGVSYLLAGSEEG